MACPQRLSAWQEEVSSAFAHLSKTQASGLALWSEGIALLWERRDCANQRSIGPGVGAKRRHCLPTPARVVSGRETETRSEPS